LYTDVLLPLDCLHSGEWAEVLEVTGEARWVGRIAELGVRVGSRLKLVQPGSPCLVEIGGCRLSLRTDDVLQIFVRPLAAAA
jgi:Fe2+ transport system protein FeoA